MIRTTDFNSLKCSVSVERLGMESHVLFQKSTVLSGTERFKLLNSVERLGTEHHELFQNSTVLSRTELIKLLNSAAPLREFTGIKAPRKRYLFYSPLFWNLYKLFMERVPVKRNESQLNVTFLLCWHLRNKSQSARISNKVTNLIFYQSRSLKELPITCTIMALRHSTSPELHLRG